MNKETRHAVKGGGDISSVRDKLSNLPNLPGVYLFKDDQQSILYIGKSKSIRNRVRSYFNNSAKHNLRIQLMVSRIHDFSLIVTDTEAEALIGRTVDQKTPSPLQRGSQGWKIVSVLQTDCWRNVSAPYAGA